MLYFLFTYITPQIQKPLNYSKHVQIQRNPKFYLHLIRHGRPLIA